QDTLGAHNYDKVMQRFAPNTEPTIQPLAEEAGRQDDDRRPMVDDRLWSRNGSDHVSAVRRDARRVDGIRRRHVDAERVTLVGRTHTVRASGCAEHVEAVGAGAVTSL